MRTLLTGGGGAPARVVRLAKAAGLIACLVASGSCNTLVKEGRTSSRLVIERLEAASGANTTVFNTFLQSDVVTNVTTTISGQEYLIPTIFEDPGRVITRLSFKDPGVPANPSSPTSANWITVTHYDVKYVRSDGRNTEGVDVPYAFRGGMTFTTLDIGQGGFVLVRGVAKAEPPLLALRSGGGAIIISTVAEVTFYGHDQTGAETSATGRISVNFADWGDPQG